MRNEILGRLHLVSLAQTTKCSPLLPGELDANLLGEARRKYRSRLNEWSSTWPSGSVDAACAHPVLITQRHDDDLSNLHLALNLALEDIIGRWWTDEEAQFPQRMPLEPEEEDLLHWIDSNQDLFRPWNERQGSLRPDFLIDIDAAGMEAFRVCEINARFCWNGYMHAGFGQDSLSAFDLESRNLIHAARAESIIGGLFNLFDNKLPLHLVKGEEHGIDIAMFIEFATKRLGIEARLITPDMLRILPDASEKSGYKLCCVSGPNSVNVIHTDSGESLEQVHQVCLELHQREINGLEPEMKRQISLRCFNDMRSILLTHDKRMLGIVREELGSLVSRRVISVEQAKWLRRGIIPTFIPGSASLDELINDCKESETMRTNYVLKPIRGGKGAGILFGDEVSCSEWMDILESMRCPALKAGKTLYVIQRKINQPYYDVLLGPKTETERCHMVGTYHSVNGRYLGLGIWRCSPERLCAISTGATWMCSLKQKPWVQDKQTSNGN